MLSLHYTTLIRCIRFTFAYFIKRNINRIENIHDYLHLEKQLRNLENNHLKLLIVLIPIKKVFHGFLNVDVLPDKVFTVTKKKLYTFFVWLRI
jgi:hypothetical protein